MDAQTVSAAQGTSTAANPQEENAAVISTVLLSHIRKELAGLSLERIEQQCRDLIQTTARAVIELGMRLLFLKEMTPHGNWLILLGRIGIEERSARRMISATIRFSSLPDSGRVIDAAKSKSKLFELLTLDAEELTHLSQGEAVRGVSLTTLPQTSVAVLRSMLKGNAPGKSADIGTFSKASSPMPPTAEPIMGNPTSASDYQSSLDTATPLNAGDRVKSIHAARLGRVVRVYADGSAGICWDDGEPQAEGLGHERMPRHLLAYFVEAEAGHGTVENTSTSTILAEEDTDYPAVYTLLPGDFNGVAVSLILHEGQAWMIAEEVAAVLGDSPEAVAEIEEIITSAFDQDTPSNGYTKVRLASTVLVVRLLNQRAIRFLDIHLDSEASTALANWMEGDAVPPAEPVKAAPLAPSGPALTLDQCLTQLKNQHYLAGRMFEQLDAQVRGIKILAEHAAEHRTAIDVSVLAGIAADIVDPYQDLMDDMDDSMQVLKRSLDRQPEPGRMLPESVWLELLQAFLMHFNEDLSMDAANQFAGLASSFHAHANESPEVTIAFKLLISFADERGAKIHDHPYPGRFAYCWNPGRAPHERRSCLHTD